MYTPKNKKSPYIRNYLVSDYANGAYSSGLEKNVRKYIPEMNLLYKPIYGCREDAGKDEITDVLESITKETHYLKTGSVKQIIDLINERIKERDKHLYALDKAICAVHTKQFGLNTDYSGDDKKLDISLEKNVSDLELNKAKERIGAWQDIAKLRKDLIPLISEYLSSLRKIGILEEGYGKPYKTGKAKYPASEKPIKFPSRRP